MGQSGIYSELKSAWWYAREGGLPSSPKQAELILSDLCNQDCHFCAYRMSGYSSNQLFMGESEPSKYGHSNPKRTIPTARALSLLSELKESGVLAVQFTGGGEPTVHKDHEEIFSKTLDLGLKASLVSNGLRWSERLKSDILPRFSWVRVSVDAGNSGSYAAIRRTSEKDWQHVWRNINDLASELKGQGADTALGLGFVVTPLSWREIPQFSALAAKSGASNVRFTAMFSTEDEGPFLEIYDDVVSLINAARDEYGSAHFAIHDNFGTRFDDLRQRSPDYSFCSHQYYTTYIGGDLNVYRCCVLAYNERGIVSGGNMAKKSFSEFWSSTERKKNMKNLDARQCDRCQFNEKNRAVNYLMQDEPKHIEFT